MYIITVYYKLSINKKKKINSFLKNNFGSYDFELEPNTIIILNIENNDIIGCVCLYHNTFLLNKVKQNNICQEHYNFDTLNGCFIYNLCVNRNYRNKKIGSKLLDFLIIKMKELNIEFLHTHAINNYSRKIFENNNFIEDNYILLNNNKIYKMYKYI
jgi:ribosomal protein S18 acetylase RimI-like enzyme